MNAMKNIAISTKVKVIFVFSNVRKFRQLRKLLNYEQTRSIDNEEREGLKKFN